MVRIAGKDAAIVFNEHNPRAVRLAEAMKNLDVSDLHVVLGLAAKGTRWFASVNTQYNPIFGLINFTRDVQSGIIHLNSTELKGEKAAILKESLRLFRDVARAGFSFDRMSAADQVLWEDFQNTGGATGYRDLYATPEDRVISLEKELSALDRGKVSKAAHSVAQWLSDYNTAMENMVRLAAYKAGIAKGMSKERAASLAKNLTVNFNRKGRQAREIGSLYAFFNASMQGTARLAETLSGPTGKKIIAGGIALGFANTMRAMAAMGAGDDDDDQYKNIKDFVKERSLLIPISHSEGVTIPMPLGFHVLPNIGRLAAEWMFGGKDKTLAGQIGKMMQILADALNPVGGSQDFAQMATPTLLGPAVALMRNKDWTGNTTYREDRNPNDPSPLSKRTKNSASTLSKELATAINYAKTKRRK